MTATEITITFAVFAVFVAYCSRLSYLLKKSRLETEWMKQRADRFKHSLTCWRRSHRLEAHVECNRYACEFHVIRTDTDGDYLVLRLKYDENDPDDYDYKRIHAEEVAEILNEVP